MIDESVQDIVRDILQEYIDDMCISIGRQNDRNHTNPGFFYVIEPSGLYTTFEYRAMFWFTRKEFEGRCERLYKTIKEDGIISKIESYGCEATLDKRDHGFSILFSDIN